PGSRSRHDWRLSPSEGMARLHHPGGDAPPYGVLARSGSFRSAPLHGPADGRSTEVRLYPLRRRAATMHREPVRADRSPGHRRYAGAAISTASAARASRRAMAARHVAVALRHEGDRGTAPDGHVERAVSRVERRGTGVRRGYGDGEPERRPLNRNRWTRDPAALSVTCMVGRRLPHRGRIFRLRVKLRWTARRRKMRPTSSGEFRIQNVAIGL